jgi:hypothetical protein
MRPGGVLERQVLHGGRHCAHALDLERPRQPATASSLCVSPQPLPAAACAAALTIAPPRKAGMRRALTADMLRPAKQTWMRRPTSSQTPGRRFQSLFAAYAEHDISWLREVLLFVALGCFTLGILFIVTPGPSWLFLLLSAVLVLTQSRTAARCFDEVELRVRALCRGQLRIRRPRTALEPKPIVTAPPREHISPIRGSVRLPVTAPMYGLVSVSVRSAVTAPLHGALAAVPLPPEREPEPVRIAISAPAGTAVAASVDIAAAAPRAGRVRAPIHPTTIVTPVPPSVAAPVRAQVTAPLHLHLAPALPASASMNANTTHSVRTSEPGSGPQRWRSRNPTMRFGI